MAAIKRLGDIFHDVRSYVDLERRARRQGEQTHEFAELQARPVAPPAIVNHGRWLVRCPWCNNGVPCDPDWPRTVCIECGSTYAPVYPQEVSDIETILMERPVMARNWEPGESVRQLRAENAERGLTRRP